MTAHYKKSGSKVKPQMHTGRRFHDLVKSRGIEVLAIAEMFGCSEQNVYKLYKKASWNQKYIAKATEKFGLPIDYFLKTELTESDHNVPLVNEHPGPDYNSYRQRFEKCQEEKLELQRELIELHKMYNNLLTKKSQ